LYCLVFIGVGIDIPGQAGSDYELWTPSDARLEGQCLMGHTIEYTRRRQKSQCYNSETFDRKARKENCQCTADDFEWYHLLYHISYTSSIYHMTMIGIYDNSDYGYERQGGSDDGDCVLSAVKPLHRDPSLGLLLPCHCHLPLPLCC
jgi:hypothetical protein